MSISSCHQSHKPSKHNLIIISIQDISVLTLLQSIFLACFEILSLNWVTTMFLSISKRHHFADSLHRRTSPCSQLSQIVSSIHRNRDGANWQQQFLWNGAFRQLNAWLIHERDPNSHNQISHCTSRLQGKDQISNTGCLTIWTQDFHSFDERPCCTNISSTGILPCARLIYNSRWWWAASSQASASSLSWRFATRQEVKELERITQLQYRSNQRVVSHRSMLLLYGHCQERWAAMDLRRWNFRWYNRGTIQSSIRGRNQDIVIGGSVLLWITPLEWGVNFNI